MLLSQTHCTLLPIGRQCTYFHSSIESEDRVHERGRAHIQPIAMAETADEIALWRAECTQKKHTTLSQKI